MFENIRKCLDEYEKVVRNTHVCIATDEELDVINYFTLNISQAIMRDLSYDKYDERVAKIILAYKGLSNEVRVKVE